MPFARRWMERHAWEEREARLSIVDDAGVDGGAVKDMTPGEIPGKSYRFVWSRVPNCSDLSNHKAPIPSELRNCNWTLLRDLHQIMNFRRTVGIISLIFAESEVSRCESLH